MIERAFLRFHKLPAGVKASITAVLTVVAFTIGAILESGVQRITGDQPEDVLYGTLWIAALLVIAAIWGLFRFAYYRVLASQEKDRQLKERAIADARERITKHNVEMLVRCDGIMGNTTVSIDDLRSVLICDLGRIDGLIKAAWDVVNSHHNVSVAATERLNFEMTLITPSLCDSELTIASWCNRDSVRPKSLLLRTEGDTNIYRRTEASKMIEKRITETLVIEDTSAPTQDYEALYPG